MYCHEKNNCIFSNRFFSISCGTKTTKDSDINELISSEILETNTNFKTKIDSKPYETVWLELSETDSGYVVYNYPSLWDDGKIAPTSITVQNDSLTWADWVEPPARLNLKNVNIEKRIDGSYFFPVGNKFLFTWYDENKHIAQWKIYMVMLKKMNLFQIICILTVDITLFR